MNSIERIMRFFKTKQNFLKKLQQLKPYEWAFIILFITQIVLILYFDFFVLREHVSNKSSWIYLKPYIIWKEKALINPNWAEQTDLFLDRLVILSSFTFWIIKNSFIYYGILKCIILTSLLILIYNITKDFNFKFFISLITLNLIIFPYLVNEFNISTNLVYFNNLLGSSYIYKYTLRTLIGLLIVKTMLDISRRRYHPRLIILSIFSCILTGIYSDNFVGEMFILPCIAYIIIRVFIDNTTKFLIINQSMYIYFCLILNFIPRIHLKNIHVFKGFWSLKNGINVFGNANYIFQCLMKLVNILPIDKLEIPIIYKKGICYVLSFLTLIMIFIAVRFIVNKCIGEFNNINRGILALIIIICCNIIAFTLFNVRYSSSIFDGEHLVSLFILLVIVIGYFFNELDKRYACLIILASGTFINGIASRYQ